MKQYLLNELIAYNIISDENKEEYAYALNVLFLKSIHLISMFILSLYLNMLFEYFLFIVTFSVFRSYSDGFHAKRASTCFMMSISFVVGLNFVLKKIHNYYFILFPVILLNSYFKSKSKFQTIKNNSRSISLFIDLFLFLLANIYPKFLISVCYGILLSFFLTILKKYNLSIYT